MLAEDGASGQVVGQLNRSLDNTCYPVLCHMVVLLEQHGGEGGGCCVQAENLYCIANTGA